ncbi:MAG TPA: flavin reductase family protein [Pseudonocardiaceae bacterium]|nr:flavin reductase family protein [Pseudonocardiaceae bacterium]
MTANGAASVAIADLKGAARRLTTGVSVLTSAHDGRVHGATVSSASVLSAQPPLMVCAFLRRGSALTELALGSGRFAMNVLSGRQALLADWFANPDRPKGVRQFDLIGWDADPSTGVPLLRDALAQLVCRLADLVPAGDHDLLLAEVVAGAVGVGNPLVTFDGGLHDVEFHGVTRRRGWRAGAGPSTTTLD